MLIDINLMAKTKSHWMEVEVTHSILELYHGVILSMKYNKRWISWKVISVKLFYSHKQRKAGEATPAFPLVSIERRRKAAFLLESPHKAGIKAISL